MKMLTHCFHTIRKDSATCLIDFLASRISRNLFITTTIMDQINWDCVVNDQRSQHDALQAPPSFICPLTKAVMFDPVVLIDDEDCVSYERAAIAAKSRCATSQLVSNMALKELIHEFMGVEWVQQQQYHQMSSKSNGTISRRASCESLSRASHECKYRQQIESLLQQVELDVTLDERNGKGSFVHDKMEICIQVPDGEEDLLKLQVSHLVAVKHITAHTREKMLHLNYILSESTVGGSLTLCQGGGVVFSIWSKISEIDNNVEDFKMILEDFCSWAFRLRVELAEEGRKTVPGGRTMHRRRSPTCVGQM
jgi:hypothetical protein